MTGTNSYQRIVQTPYGQGTELKQEDDGRYIIKLSGFGPRGGTLYTHERYQSVLPKVGDDVHCTFGRGIVVELLNDSKQVKVRLSSWRLAQRSTVTCYLQLSSSSSSNSNNNSVVNVVRKKTLREMDTFERVSHGQQLKSKASKLFTSKSYQKALNLYADAVDSVRFVQHDAASDNYIRADLVLLMVTCSNNAATCCVQLEKFDQTHRFATNALVLLDALYAKRGKKIHAILNADGFSDVKLFAEFTNKSRLLMATADFHAENLDKAVLVLKKAEGVIVQFLEMEGTAEGERKVLRVQEKQIKKLHAQCLHRKKTLRKKEIKRAQAMFGGASNNNSTSTTVDTSVEKEDGKSAPLSYRENNDTSSTTTTTNVSSTTTTVTPSSNGSSTSSTANTAQKPQQNPKKLLTRSSSSSMKKVTFAPPENNQTKTITPISMDDEKKCDSELEDFHTQRRRQQHEEEEEDEEEVEPWYEEHKEALILVGLAGLAGLSTMLLRSSKS